MTYFKRLTNQYNQPHYQSSQLTFQTKIIPSQNYDQSFQQFPPKATKINKPYKSIRPNKIPSFKQISQYNWYQKQSNIHLTGHRAPVSPVSDNYVSQTSKYNTRQLFETGSQSHIMSLKNVQKVNHSVNTSPIIQKQKQKTQESKYSEQFFLNLMKMMKKFNDEEKQKSTHKKQQCIKCNCSVYKQQNKCFQSPKQNKNGINNNTISQQYMRQAPIIINNIIKPDENRRDQKLRSKDHYLSKQYEQIDRELIQQQYLIKRLQLYRNNKNYSYRQSNNQFRSKQYKGFNNQKKIRNRYKDVYEEDSYKKQNNKYNLDQLKKQMQQQKFREVQRDDEIQLDQQLKFRTTNNTIKKQQQIVYTSQPNTNNKKQKKRSFNMYKQKTHKINTFQQSSNYSLIQNKLIKQQTTQQTKQDDKIITQQKQQIKRPVFFQLPINQNIQKISLAQAFLKRKGIKKTQTKQQKTNRYQKSNQKTKQQLIQIRKQMMKKKSTPLNCINQPEKKIFQQITPINLKKQINFVSADLSKNSTTKFVRQPSQELLQRLIYGVKPKIDQKQMKALTQKNYEMLPEVKKRRQQQRKKEQFQRRMMIKKQFEKNLRNRK